MNQGISLLATSIVAAAVLTAKRGVSPTGTLPAAGGRVLGPARTDAAIGERVAVDRDGTAPWESGGAFSAGDKLQIDASGRVVVFAAGVFCGIAEEAATGAGQFPEVLIVPN